MVGGANRWRKLVGWAWGGTWVWACGDAVIGSGRARRIGAVRGSYSIICLRIYLIQWDAFT